MVVGKLVETKTSKNGIALVSVARIAPMHQFDMRMQAVPDAQIWLQMESRSADHLDHYYLELMDKRDRY